jgi:hypothetical protein
MLDRRERPWWSERTEPSAYGSAPEPLTRARTEHETRSEFQPERRRRATQPRLLVALVLIAAAVVWSIARGLHFYGLSPVNLIYDLDQPPLLLALVAGWLWYRSRAR